MGTNLYIDLDGVLVDFDLGYLKAFGYEHHTVHVGKMWKNIASNPTHWEDLPPLKGWDVIWDYVKGFNPIILTGCPTSGRVNAEIGKRKWVEKHLGNVEVITCLSKDKQIHMKNKGDVLIDDRIKNCDRWREAGGREILYDGDTTKLISNLKQFGF